jgi:hypothetical protein
VAKFAPGHPVVTPEPFVVADGVPPGVHVFTLVVVDDDGNPSQPARAVVRVVQQRGGGTGGPAGPGRGDGG